MKKIIGLFIATTMSIGLISQVQAHSRWLLPSHYNMSSEKGLWLMADATASNEVFNIDKALSIDVLRILTPKGKLDKPSSVYKGHRKSVIDYFVADSGTYKLTNNYPASYRTRYKLNGKNKRLLASKAELTEKLPKGASDVSTTLSYARVETYVTMNNPSDNFGQDGTMLELLPITHPSDIVEGEQAKFKFVFNGKAIAGVQVEIILEGVRYRNDPQVTSLVSNDKGEISFTPKSAGRYLLIAEFERTAKNQQLADLESSEVFLSFEAQLN